MPETDVRVKKDNERKILLTKTVLKMQTERFPLRNFGFTNDVNFSLWVRKYPPKVGFEPR